MKSRSAVILSIVFTYLLLIILFALANAYIFEENPKEYQVPVDVHAVYRRLWYRLSYFDQGEAPDDAPTIHSDSSDLRGLRCLHQGLIISCLKCG